jgi:hypothetical protein
MKLPILLSVALLFGTPAVNATPSTYDRGLMLEVPGIGYSRVETLSFCLNFAGVDKYQDLLTDSEFVTFNECMADNT